MCLYLYLYRHGDMGVGGTEQLRFHRGWIGSQVWPTMCRPGDVYPVILCVLCIFVCFVYFMGQPCAAQLRRALCQECAMLVAPNDDTVYFADYQTKRAREHTKQVTLSSALCVSNLQLLLNCVCNVQHCIACSLSCLL